MPTNLEVHTPKKVDYSIRYRLLQMRSRSTLTYRVHTPRLSDIAGTVISRIFCARNFDDARILNARNVTFFIDKVHSAIASAHFSFDFRVLYVYTHVASNEQSRPCTGSQIILKINVLNFRRRRHRLAVPHLSQAI